MWIMELFTDFSKTDLLKVYSFSNAKEIAYVLQLETSIVYNYYHGLIKPRSNLRYVNLYKK